MNLNRTKMFDILRHQLAVDMNCDANDFLSDGIVFSEAKANDGRRLFERQKPYLEIATMGKGIVLTADKELLVRIRPLLENKSRDDVFSAPFVYGHSLYYVPDCKIIQKLPYQDGFTIHVKEGKDIFSLYHIPGFHNAIQYDENHIRPDGLVVYAMHGNQIVGMAGASIDCKVMWQIGIDVLPPFRFAGLASSLVSNLAVMIMERDIVPYYGTASSNIASQAVAYRSGLVPAWMCTYKNVFDGSSPYKKESGGKNVYELYL